MLTCRQIQTLGFVRYFLFSSDLVDLLLFVDAELARATVDQEKQTTDDGQNLEEVVFGKVLVGVVLVKSPEVVHQQVEAAEDDDQQRSAVLGLEANNDHDTGASAKDADEDAPEGPLAAEDEANEEEDEENTTRQLEVHLLVLLVQGGETSKGLALAHPRVREDHEEATNDGQVSQEEVEIEDQAVAESLNNHNAHESRNSVIRVLSGDDESGAGGHGENVEEEEDMGNSGWNVAVIVKIQQLVAPLGDDSERILEEGDDNQKSSNCRHVWLDGLTGRVQDILDLAGVRPQLIQDAAAVGLVGNSNTSTASRIGAGTANAIARRTTVRHFDQSCPMTFFFPIPSSTLLLRLSLGSVSDGCGPYSATWVDWSS